MILEILKRGKARPLSRRRNQYDVVIEYLIARSDGEIFVHIIDKRHLHGDEFHGGALGKKYYSLSSLAPYIKLMPDVSQRPGTSETLKAALPRNNNTSGAIVAVLRAEGVLMSSPPSEENYSYSPLGPVSGCRSWSNPDYSIDDFLREMVEMDTLDVVEVPESKIWCSPRY